MNAEDCGKNNISAQNMKKKQRTLELVISRSIKIANYAETIRSLGDEAAKLHSHLNLVMSKYRFKKSYFQELINIRAIATPICKRSAKALLCGSFNWNWLFFEQATPLFAAATSDWILIILLIVERIPHFQLE